MKFTKKNGGFTLVELIVVIAILAILAAIAVPAYSGYIKKANEAADQQLLAAVNTAYAAACLENNEDMLTMDPTTVKVTMQGPTGNRTIKTIAPFGDYFDMYFASNKGTAFKIITGLTLENGVFVSKGDSAYYTTANYAGNNVYVSTDKVNKVNNSIIVDDDVLGTDVLLNRVDNLTGLGSSMTGVFADASFQELAADKLGCDVSELDKVLNDMAKGDETLKGQIMGNAVVLFAADSIGKMDSAQMKALLTAPNAFENIMNQEDRGDALSQAALMYGMYNMYAAQNGETVTGDALTDLDKMSKDAGFQAYLNGTGGNGDAAKDLEAFTAALGMINESTETGEALSDVLIEGFGTDNKDLTDTINQILGSSN